MNKDRRILWSADALKAEIVAVDDASLADRIIVRDEGGYYRVTCMLFEPVATGTRIHYGEMHVSPEQPPESVATMTRACIAAMLESFCRAPVPLQP